MRAKTILRRLLTPRDEAENEWGRKLLTTEDKKPSEQRACDLYLKIMCRRILAQRRHLHRMSGYENRTYVHSIREYRSSWRRRGVSVLLDDVHDFSFPLPYDQINLDEVR